MGDFPLAEKSPLPPTRLADRLAAARRFVGRTAELALWQEALSAQPPPFAVLHLHGPGGVGKSSLLRQFLALARQAGRVAGLLDGREIDASPAGFLQALSQVLELPASVGPLEALAQAKHPVLLIDTYERLAPLDGWLRDTFLPQLPAEALAAIAGRNPPALGWREGEWADLTRSVSLRNLRPEESLAYLEARGVPTPQRSSVLRFTHGHPLALSLVADVSAQMAQQGRQADFNADQVPDVVAALLARFIDEVPGPQHRLSLHTCATVRVLTEPLLRAALGQDDVQAVFAWLRGLSFIEAGPRGLYPHDLAREVLDNDLRWRDPESYRALHYRVREAMLRQLHAAEGAEQLGRLFDLVYLHRHNPILQSYYVWQELGSHYVAAIQPSEHAEVRALLDHLSAVYPRGDHALWLARQPEAWHVIRNPRGEVAGVFAYLALHVMSDDDRRLDPGVAAAWDHQQRHAPLRPGDEASLTRIYVPPDHYTQPSPVMNTAQLAVGVRWMTNRRLAWSYTELPNPDHWHAMMSYYDFQRVEDPRTTLYAHDWRAVPVAAWFDLVGSRELATDLRVEDLAAKAATPLLVLSQPEFEDAVKDALRDLHAPDALAANPLARSRVLAGAAEAGPALRNLLLAGAKSLRANPKDEKFSRALEATYFTPAATQELAAERLGLPFSTYRYHLTHGVRRLTEWLWQRELHPPQA